MTKTYILGSVSRFALNNKEMHYDAWVVVFRNPKYFLVHSVAQSEHVLIVTRVNILAETAYLFPLRVCQVSFFFPA